MSKKNTSPHLLAYRKIEEQDNRGTSVSDMSIKAFKSGLKRLIKKYHLVKAENKRLRTKLRRRNHGK